MAFVEVMSAQPGSDMRTVLQLAGSAAWAAAERSPARRAAETVITALALNIAGISPCWALARAHPGITGAGFEVVEVHMVADIGAGCVGMRLVVPGRGRAERERRDHG